MSSSVAPGTAERPPDLTNLRNRLDPFFQHNQNSTLVARGSRAVVKDPWADDTLILRLPEDPDEAIETLNSLILPPLYSALFHRDRQDLEFIYTPVRTDVHGRTFQFAFRGRSYRCEFADASDRLKKLAAMARPVEPPSTTGS